MIQTESKRVGVSWESNLVFVVSDSDAFDSCESTAAIMKPSLSYAPKLYSNPTNCHLSSNLYSVSVCVCGGGFTVCVGVGVTQR